jgi:hypothetical protein
MRAPSRANEAVARYDARVKCTVVLPALVFALLVSACGGGGGGGSGNGNSSLPGGSSTSSDTSHGTASCQAGNAVFTTSPLPLSSVIGWVPLGSMEPPGHTFPTDHQYLYYANPGSPGNTTLNVVAPSDLRIWMIYQDTGSANEYSIWIQPCAQIIGRLGSITGLSSDLSAAAGAINQSCQTFGSSTQCQKALTYDVKAGQTIGTINSSTEYALDWWLWDTRVTPIAFVDPAEFTGGPDTGFTEADIVPASAYYTAAMTPQIDAKLGSFDGTQQRTTAPVDGTIAVDVANTARGYWFNPSQAYPPENYQVALAPDNIAPNTTEVISLGVSQANFSNGGGSGVRGSFTPLATGLIDRAFETVTADGNTYCYNPLIENTAGQSGLIILQMPTAASLKIEVQALTGGSCASAQPWTFTANAVTYKR